MTSENRKYVAAQRRYHQEEIKTMIRQMKIEGGTLDLVSAKFSLSHAAISAPQLLDCEALFGSE